MLTLETDHILSRVNSAKSVGHENYIDIQIINLVSFRRLELSDIGSRESFQSGTHPQKTLE